jgi:L-arabinokinase
LPTIAFYISGHGFGHASREIEIINALFARRIDLRIIVRTSAAKWLFEKTVMAGLKPGPTSLNPGPSQQREDHIDNVGPGVSRTIFEFHPLEVDTGMVQIDSLHLDTAGSVRRARDFMQDFDARVAAEARFLRDERVTLVVADIPPLGLAAAHRAGVPGVGLSNFTWDWIYSAYPGTGSIVSAIGQAYAKADVALRLPMHGGFATFPRVIDLPFVARRSTRDPQETRGRLGLPRDERLVLVSFGGYGLERLDREALARLESLEGYVAMVSPGPAAALPSDWPAARLGGLLPFDESRMYAAGIRYEDLVRSVDVVISKPGYGIISECVANDTALLYTSRGAFIEYDVFVAEMPRVLRAGFIDHDDLFAGRWAAALDAVLAQPAPPEQPAVDGAEVAAALLLEMVG